MSHNVFMTNARLNDINGLGLKRYCDRHIATVGASISIRSVFAKYRAVLFEGEWKYCACSVEQGSMVFGKCTLPMTDVANGSQLGVWDLFHKMISSYATMSGCI
jgi:hypothetical protein